MITKTRLIIDCYDIDPHWLYGNILTLYWGMFKKPRVHGQCLHIPPLFRSQKESVGREGVAPVVTSRVFDIYERARMTSSMSIADADIVMCLGPMYYILWHAWGWRSISLPQASRSSGIIPTWSCGHVNDQVVVFFDMWFGDLCDLWKYGKMVAFQEVHSSCPGTIKHRLFTHEAHIRLFDARFLTSSD